MHPMIQRDLIQARVADLHREAARLRLAAQGRQRRRPRTGHGSHPAPGHRATILVRRALAALGARSL
jgi:hypothetical protein